MNSKKSTSYLWKKTGMLAATAFLSQMAFTSATFAPSGLAPAAQAQPDLNNAPKGENPPPRNRPNKGGNNEKRRNPEEGVRMMLNQAGVNDAATQTAVLDYIKADMKARGPLREQGGRIFRVLRDDAVTDDQLLALVTDYRAAQQAEKARREQAQKDLDAKINYSENPRLEAMLLLAGLIGDGPMMLQGGGRGERGEGGGRGGGGGRGEGGDNMNREERQKKMLERFDANKDGQLDNAEKAAMQEFIQQRREKREQRDKEGQPKAAPVMEN